MGHGHGHGAARAGDRRRLRLVLAITLAVLVAELVGAWVSGSLALLADAAHMATDATAVVIALGASYVAGRPAGPRSTFGLHRAEILATLLNTLVLLAVCAYLAWAGVRRLHVPADVDAGPMLGFAVVGLAANGVSLLVLQRSVTGSLNVRAASLEVAADLLGSVLAVVAAFCVLLLDWRAADPLASLLIAALILPRTVLLMRDALSVLLEIAPREVDLDGVRGSLLSVDGVTGVHDLHCWTITSGLPSLSAHVTVSDDCLERRGVGAVLDELSHCVREAHGVPHATFQVEPAGHADHEDLGEVH